MNLVVILLIGVVMAIGLAGVILPFMPGLPIVWFGALAYGVLVGFTGTGIVAMVVITVLAGLGIAATVVLPARSGRASGASFGTLLLAGLVGVIGFFVVPVIGFPLGACLGILVSQYHCTGEWDAAWRSTIAVIRGFGIGLLTELGAGVAMIIVWVVWVLLD